MSSLVFLRCRRSTLLLLASVALLSPPRASAQEAVPEAGHRFEVKVTNLTRGQQFTPILVVSHRAGIRLFELGSPASPELQALAEEGNTAPLTDLLSKKEGVLDVVTAGPLLDPGASRTIHVRTRGGFDHLSVASMLIPTNDGFLALNEVPGPQGGGSTVLLSPAYDSGSERNDELCASIPGPFFEECGGPGGGGAVAGGEEGYVHINAAIHGVGDMEPAQRDWRNPVARIEIRRVR